MDGCQDAQKVAMMAVIDNCLVDGGCQGGYQICQGWLSRFCSRFVVKTGCQSWLSKLVVKVGCQSWLSKLVIKILFKVFVNVLVDHCRGSL
jgi:hypothetical protein